MIEPARKPGGQAKNNNAKKDKENEGSDATFDLPEKKQQRGRDYTISRLKRDAQTSDQAQAVREERKETIKDLYLQCFTAEEIGKAVGLPRKTAEDVLSAELESLPKSPKVTFSEESWKPPIYNVTA